MDELISKDKLRQEALSIGGHLYSEKNDNIPTMKPDINPMWFAGSKFCPNCGKTMIKAEDNK